MVGSNTKTLNNMDLKISVGFHWSPDNPSSFPGIMHGGIHISVDGRVLTRYGDSYDGFANYDINGDQLEHSEQYVGEYLMTSLDNLRMAIVRFQRDDFDRYEAIPARMVQEPGDSTIVLSFCDSDHARIAFQPVSADPGHKYPLEVAVGYAIDPDEMCHELIKCFRECITFVEKGYTDWEYGDLSEGIDDVHDWADESIEELLAVTTDD